MAIRPTGTTSARVDQADGGVGPGPALSSSTREGTRSPRPPGLGPG